MRTGLPSFIVTLAFLFILRGFTILFAAADRAQDHHRRHRQGGRRRLARRLFGGKILTGLFAWLGDAGVIAVFERGNRAGQNRSSTAFRC
jgi:simple sugar transport system permease protein